MPVYEIRQKRNPLALYASGFYSLERAQAWLANYDPHMWTDKTIRADDLEITEEKTPGLRLARPRARR